MQPPHTFVAMAGGSPIAAFGIAETSRTGDHARPATATPLHTRRSRPRPPMAVSRRVRLAMAARRLVSRPA